MSKTGKWAKRTVWATLVTVFAVGCNPLSTIAFIFHRDEKLPPAYPMAPKDDEATGKKREDVKVAVFCQFAHSMPLEFATADRDLAGLLAKKCPELVKESGSKVKLEFINPSEVDAFKRANPTWKSMHPAAWGKKLGADYVMEVTLGGMQLYKPHSNNEIYEGRADVTVDIYDVEKPKAAPLHNYVHPFRYPKSMMMSVDSIAGVNQFKQVYLDHLAAELLLKHVEHKSSIDIAADR